MRFRVRQSNAEKSSTTEPAPPADAAPENGAAPSPPAAEAPETNGTSLPPNLTLLERRLVGGQATMKGQASGTEARAERLVRQVQHEVAELREALEAVRSAPGGLTALDLDAVARDPEAAAKLPPALLVRALIELRERNMRLEQKLARRRERIRKLEERVRELKQERAWYRGRQQTLDEVIAALHANLQDLRLHRDTHQVEAPQRATIEPPGAIAEPGEPARLP